MTDEIKPRVRAYETTKPTPENDGVSLPIRGTKYGEQYVRPLPGERYVFADEGSYFVAHNAINDAATTLAGHAAPVLVDADDTMTKPFIFLRVPTGATKKLRLDYIEIDVVTATTGKTTDNYAWQLDSGATRWSSGGSALTIVNPNMDSAETSMLTGQTNHLLGGAVVTGAETANVRQGGHGQMRSAIDIIGDRYMFKFGGDPTPGANVVATAASRHLITLPPIVLGADDQFLLALYGPSQSAAGVYKVRMAWWER